MKWTVDELNQFRRDYPNKKLKLSTLSERYHKSVTALQSKAHAIKLNRHRINTPDQCIIDEYKKGFSCLKISKEHECDIGTVINILKRNRVKQRTDKYVTGKKYKVNHRYFDKINSQEKAYFLGFIYADGNVRGNDLTISLVRKDGNILKRFSHLVKTNRPLTPVPGKGRDKPQTKFQICNKYMISKLKELGVVERKSLILKFPSWLKPFFFSHFIRGYFDGDGSISLSYRKDGYAFSLCGTKEFLNEIQKIFRDVFGVKYRKLYRKKCVKVNSYSLSYTGRIMVDTIMSWIYKDSKIALRRKKKKYKYLKSIVMKAAKKRHYRTSIMPLSNAQINEIRKLRNQGVHCEELCEKFEVGRTTVYNILSKRKNVAEN